MRSFGEPDVVTMCKRQTSAMSQSYDNPVDDPEKCEAVPRHGHLDSVVPAYAGTTAKMFINIKSPRCLSPV